MGVVGVSTNVLGSKRFTDPLGKSWSCYYSIPSHSVMLGEEVEETPIFTGFGGTGVSQASGRCLIGQDGEAVPVGSVSLSLSPSTMCPLSALLLLFVTSITGESMIMQIGQGTAPSLCWPFCALWYIIAAIIAGELRGVAIMTTSNRWMRGVPSPLSQQPAH